MAYAFTTTCCGLTKLPLCFLEETRVLRQQGLYSVVDRKLWSEKQEGNGEERTLTLSFREARLSETGLPRITVIGSSVSRADSPLTTSKAQALLEIGY